MTRRPVEAPIGCCDAAANSPVTAPALDHGGQLLAEVHERGGWPEDPRW